MAGCLQRYACDGMVIQAKEITDNSLYAISAAYFFLQTLDCSFKNYCMNEVLFGKEYLKELDAETKSSRKCVERIPPELFKWKPHEKSMEMGYLALLVAEIPRWIKTMIEDSEIDFATFKHFPATTTEDLVKQFDENIEGARNALQNVSNEELDKPFALKTNGQTIFSSPKKENVSSTINHWVHHRGQLTVYMRLNNINVPSIYGPSADDKSFG